MKAWRTKGSEHHRRVSSTAQSEDALSLTGELGLDDHAAHGKKHKPSFLDWTRRASVATKDKLDQKHGEQGLDASDPDLEVELKRFKEIEETLMDMREYVKSYSDGVKAILASYSQLGSLGLSGTNGSTATSRVSSSVIDVLQTALVRGWAELMYGPIKDARKHVEQLKWQIKKHDAELAGSKGGQARMDSSLRSPPPDSPSSRSGYASIGGSVSSSFSSASTPSSLTSSQAAASTEQLRIQLLAFEEAFAVLQQTVSQGHQACEIFLHYALLSHMEGISLDESIRKALDRYWEVVHPETGRFLAWLKSNSFAIEQGLNPDELGGCVAPFDVVVTSMVTALQPKLGHVFAKPLAGLLDVPAVIKSCMAFLDQHGLYEEGLFRVPGNAETVQGLRKRFDEGGDVSGVLAAASAGVHDVATLFKLYFRELPSPLIPAGHCTKALLATRTLGDDEFIEVATEELASIHPTHAKTLRLLLALLYRVSLCSDANKMSAKNLAVCFAPSLLRSGEGEELALADIQPAIVLISRLIDHAEELYPDTLWEDYPATGNGGRSRGNSPIPETAQEES